MIAFLFKRVLLTIPTLVGVTILSFALIRLIPGDPILLLLGDRGASPEVYEEMRRSYGLDEPLWKQYGLFVSKAVQGDLGKSIASGRSVLEEFYDRFVATLELSVVALFLAVFVGIPLGIIAALNRGKWLDYTLMTGALIGYSMPIFWWGLVLIMIFSVNLGWTPVSGRIDLVYDVTPWSGMFLVDVWKNGLGWEAFVSTLAHMILPCIVLATIPLASIARMMRSSLLEVMGEDYVRTARSKGMSPWRVITIHALKNALLPVVTIIGLMAGTLVTGAVLTETIFSWPGVGRWLVQSVLARDYPVIQGGILVIAISIMVINTLVDLVYAFLNPRLRSQL